MPKICAFDGAWIDVLEAIHATGEPIHVVHHLRSGQTAVARDKQSAWGTTDLRLMATLPPQRAEQLGEPSFCKLHGVRYPYIAGEMANGIATTKMVVAMADAEMLGFFGAAGLSLPRIEQAVEELCQILGDRRPWGVNLIHSPNEPDLEERAVDLFVRRGVARVSASAFMTLTPSVVRYAASGLHLDGDGGVRRKHHLFAKLSRPELAQQFLTPAPETMLRRLVERGAITAQEAALAAEVPVAEDITVEADSGGHTDNRPLVALLPLVLALRDEIAVKHRYTRPIRIGAAGGLGTPSAVAAAFALGAAYVLTGSINQSAVEAGVSDEAKAMLARAKLADVMMAPAADMFELGVKLQVLKLGTMFGGRAQRLYDTYLQNPSLEALPADLKARLEKDLFRAPIEEIWAETRRFWERRDANEVHRADRDPKHRMALTFRWYLGKASRWAIEGEPSRRVDYQIWCGPAMGAFNSWVEGSFLADPAQRTVVQIARNLLQGAAVVTRAQQLRSFGVSVPDGAFTYRPRPLDHHLLPAGVSASPGPADPASGVLIRPHTSQWVEESRRDA